MHGANEACTSDRSAAASSVASTVRRIGGWEFEAG
jgi:hypothetical protein